MANPKYATLVANTVSTVTLDADFTRVEVVVDTAASGNPNIYVTVGGSTPAAQTDGSILLPGFGGSAVELSSPEGEATIIKLKCSGTPVLQVRGL